MKTSLIKQPSAWIPIVLSLITLATMLTYLVVSAPPIHQTDEGTAAHLFQIWLVLEVVLIGFFTIKWLPRNPKDTLFILAIQIVTIILACYPVFYFKL
jgi:hypothetical protein